MAWSTALSKGVCWSHSDQGPCSSSCQATNNQTPPPPLFLLVCKATCNPFLSLLEAGLFCDGNWAFSPRSSITSTAHRLLTPLSQGNSGKTVLLGEIPSLVINISSLKKKNVPPTHFAWRQKSASYFSKPYPFLPRKTLNQPNGSCCPSTGKRESNN